MNRVTTLTLRYCLLPVLLTLLASALFAGDEPLKPLVWRTVGHFSNSAPDSALIGFAATDGIPEVTANYQAGPGLHVLYPSPGAQTVSFDDTTYVYPTILGPVTARVEAATLLDLPVYWLYEADNLVSGQPFAEAGQTFVATGDELARVSCRMVGKSNDTFEVVVCKGGPGGEQVGPPATFTVDDRSGRGTAEWRPGDVPLELRETHYIGIKSRSGKPFAMRTHSTGDAYAQGCAVYEGVPEPGADLGLSISMQRDDAVRSTVLYTYDDEGWVLHTRGVYFRARSANVRAVYARVKLKDSPREIDAAFRIHRLEGDGSLVRIGEDRKCHANLGPGGDYYVAALYAADDIPLEIGKTYYVEIIPFGEGLPQEESQIPKRDLLVSIYGEKTPGMTPILYNQRIADTTQTSVKLAWEGSPDSFTRIHYGLSPYKLDRAIDVPKGQHEAEIGPISPGITFCFRMALTSEAGGTFMTPVYQARTLGADSDAQTDPPPVTSPRDGFLDLAPMDRVLQPTLPKMKELAEAAITNGGFEDSLDGWTTDRGERVGNVDLARSGASSAGWDQGLIADSGKQVPTEDVIYQQLAVTLGKTYMLSAYLYTAQDGGMGDETGDVTARLICDPTGGTDFTGHNSTQWFRTDGKWLQFAKIWKAEADTITIGVSFSKSHNWPRAAALADDIRLVEVREPKLPWYRQFGRE